MLAVPSRCVFRLTGPDRVRWLNGQVTQDVAASQPGRAAAACVTDRKGRLQAAPVFLHALPDGATLLIDAPAELREDLFARLDQYLIADDCELADVSDDLRILHVLPEAASAGAPSPPAVPAGLPGVPVVASDTCHRFGPPGTDLVVPAPQADATIAALGFGPAIPDDAPAIDLLRIRYGVPEWSRDLAPGPDLLVSEIPFLVEHAVSFTKGCYIGQEVISRIKSAGKVNRSLATLEEPAPAAPTTDSPSPGPVPGQRLVPADDDSPAPASAREAGRLGTVAVDPDTGRRRALAVLRREFLAESGTGRLLHGLSDENMLSCRFQIGKTAATPSDR